MPHDLSSRLAHSTRLIYCGIKMEYPGTIALHQGTMLSLVRLRRMATTRCLCSLILKQTTTTHFIVFGRAPDLAAENSQLIPRTRLVRSDGIEASDFLYVKKRLSTLQDSLPRSLELERSVPVLSEIATRGFTKRAYVDAGASRNK